MAILVNKETCIGCAICVKKCPFDAITMENKKAVIGVSCTSCKQCIEPCPVKAISAEVEEEKTPLVNLSDYKNIWVYAEQRQGKIMGVVYELLGEATRLAEERGEGTKVGALLLGDNVGGLTDELFAYGADIVYVADDPLLKLHDRWIYKSHQRCC